MAIIVRKNKTRVAYQVKVRDSVGRWFPSPTFSTKAEAEKFERSLLFQKDHGHSAFDPSLKTLLFNEYTKQWVIDCRSKASDGWKITQHQMLRDFILPILGQMALVKIRSMDIGKVMNQDRLMNHSNGSKIHVYNLMHKMFEDAIEHYEYVQRSPVLKRYRPKNHKTERNFLKPEESYRLLEVSKDHHMGPAVWIGLYCALRPCEIQGLRKKCVDFEKGRIQIQESFNRKTNILQPHPKQKNWGDVPMPPVLMDYLRSKLADKSDEDFVIQGTTGNMLNYNRFLTHLETLCRKANVQRITPHELRHSCTELYVEQGASSEDIRRLLNQSSLSATAPYIHRTPERLKSLSERVGPVETHPQDPPKLRLVR